MRDTVLRHHAVLEHPCNDDVLGALSYSADRPESLALNALEMPCLNVSMRRLGVDTSICEVWQGSGQLTQGRYGDIHYRHDGSVLYGVITLPETDATDDGTPLQQATESAYHQLFSLLDSLRFPYVFRVWNYMADINVHSFGLERYQQFNQGRQDAFLAHERDVIGNVPAACALGFSQGALTIAFLAGRIAPLCFENPRQISSSLYPPQYGLRSPTFSRASLATLSQGEVLFISGTASIVGHATVHHGDVVAQTRETMINIEAVLSEVNRQVICRYELSSLNYKVYVRSPADLRLIQTELTRYVGDSLRAVYLHADVCRHDLLIEIEATGMPATGQGM